MVKRGTQVRCYFTSCSNEDIFWWGPIASMPKIRHESVTDPEEIGVQQNVLIKVAPDQTSFALRAEDVGIAEERARKQSGLFLKSRDKSFHGGNGCRRRHLRCVSSRPSAADEF
eukprot:TRINITY_DN20229_c0_g1_i1.p1 TRINITY_DN20229_c0_g1~~TRINITY_DN20229_c0_g1_i1.p1  ORF type:complete len:114 (-),score=14.87 TRINITY_DN20229_c0_g1_i1:122-463(-)